VPLAVVFILRRRVVPKSAAGGNNTRRYLSIQIGLLHSAITQPSDGHIVQLERIKILVEVKRLYRGDEGRRLPELFNFGVNFDRVNS